MPLESVTRRLVAAALLAPLLADCGPAIGKAAALPDDMSLGDPKARVKVVEYASVGCPVCAKWGREIFPAFKAKYLDTGKVRFTYREMLVGGDLEVAAAAAGFVLARCAGSSRYFPVVEAIYRRQDEAFASLRPTLADIAGRDAGLSDAAFSACLADESAFKALNARVDANRARDGGVHATPTFVVNGRKLEAGFQPLAALDAAIARA